MDDNKLNSYSNLIAKIAFLGGRGSYSQLAARDFFASPQNTESEVFCDSFKQVIEQVEQGKATYGILPIENTSSGSINEVYDLLQHTFLTIVGEITQKIQHGLLVAIQAESEEIKTLYSHSQPYEQCSEFLSQFNKLKTILCESTAQAMETVARLKDPRVAAIGSVESGKLYGLVARYEDIANQAENYTRFILVSRAAIELAPSALAKTTFIISTRQSAGSLVDCLLLLKKYKIKMTKLASRPIIGNPWEEMFYIDIEGNMHEKSVKKAFKELKEQATYMKILGCYPIKSLPRAL